ncbi:hypothetical protein RMCBS344292_08799 [Rhizopus microsporus]|nr:hypothetical protein RMCBS344292_08799 [Rhizopus microsporus]
MNYTVYNIFYGAFGDLSFDVISLYDFAFTNAPNILYLSVALLREATNFTLLPFEFRSWSLLPVAKHGIAHISLSVQQFDVNINQYYPDLMPLAAFSDNYNAENKEALWEHVFNIDHLQKNRQRKQN